MITDLHAAEFTYPVTVNPGDTLHVTHTVLDGPKVHTQIVAEHKSNFTVTWTHSILFKLNGEQQWMVGTQNTIDWLGSQQHE